MERLRRNWDISLILLLFLALGVAYSVVNPLHEATDELRHYRYVRSIVVNRALPVQGEEPCRSQSHHPPLFYVAGALLTGWIETGRGLCQTPEQNPFWAYRYTDVGTDNKNMYLHGPEEDFPWRGEALAAHLLRFLNVIVGAGTVWFAWATGRAIWPTRRALANGAAAFIAFNPMFLYMAGAINNDVIAAFSGAAVLFTCVSLLRDPAGLSRRWGLVFGGVYGLALLSKFNMAVVAVLIALAVTYVAWKRQQWRRWFEVGILTVGVAALLAGWWFVRNQLLYGDPTGFEMVTRLWGMREPSIPLVLLELPHAWSTLWGRFGFGQIPLPSFVYQILRGVALLGMTGLLLPLIRGEDTRFIFLLLLITNVLLAFAVLFNYMLVSPAGAMGRFFFPGLPALSLLLAYGLSRWWLLLLPAWRRFRSPPGEAPSLRLLALLLNGTMLLFALVALFGYLAPAYARPPSFAEAELPNEVNIRFDTLATLRGYSLSTTTLRPGEPLDLDLYWEVNARPPGNYLLFVHLIDEAGTVIAQRDTHPGTGNFPTAYWRPGDRFVDSVRLFLPETTYTPTTATVSIGLYAPTYRLGVVGPGGEALGDYLPLDTLQLRPAVDLYPGAENYPNPLEQNFENEMRLIGYDYDGRELLPGAGLDLNLYWQVLPAASSAYLVQVQLVDAAGMVRGEIEEKLRASAVTAGATISAHYHLALDEDLEPGTYGVRLALLDPAGRERNKVMAEDGHWLYDILTLAPIRIQEKASVEEETSHSPHFSAASSPINSAPDH